MRGFTVLEILVALVVLTLVGAIVVPRFLGLRGQAQQAVDLANAKTNEVNALYAEYTDMGNAVTGVQASPGAVYHVDSSNGVSTLTVDSGQVSVSSAAYSDPSKFAIKVNGGTVKLNGSVSCGTVSLSGGRLDLGQNTLTVLSQPAATLTPLVAAGRNYGSWDGANGITSSAAAADTSGTHALAVFDGATYNAAKGTTVPPTASVITYALAGDLNLDGTVNYLDYGIVDHGYLGGLSGYSNGDVNYDGTINYLDYGVMDNTFLRLNAPQPH